MITQTCLGYTLYTLALAKSALTQSSVFTKRHKPRQSRPHPQMYGDSLYRRRGSKKVIDVDAKVM